MSRYRKPVHIPRPDEEPEEEDIRFYYEEALLDLVCEYGEIEQRRDIGGYYDERRVRWVA